MPGRRIVTLVAAWTVAVGLAWGLVARPERCGAVTVEQVRSAATEAVAWFERNQLPDGRWTYGYDRDTDFVDRQPHDVRHSGVILALYQADAAGIPGARELADRGTEWSLRQLIRDGDRSVVALRDPVPTGATALLVAGLAERRATTGDPRYDDELQAMARFLVSVTEPSGAVPAFWDPDQRRPIPDVYSAFFTGETYFALASLAAVDPAGNWQDTADRIGHYLATDRDRVEDRFPPSSDHWGAYGLAATVLGGNGPLGDDERAYARRLGAIFGVQVRYESQRTGEGLNRWVLRGPRASGGGLGTLGEGLGSLWRVAGEDDELAGDRPQLAERLRCVAAMLVDRQVETAEAAEASRPELAQGAWFRLGYTQKDQQQHALSALLQALPAVAEDDRTAGSSGDDAAGRVVWLLVIAAALVNPIRARRLGAAQTGAMPSPSADEGGMARPGESGPPGEPGTTAAALPKTHAEGAGKPPLEPSQRSAVISGALLGGVGLAVLAAVAGPLLRAIDVSAPTALIAAGIVVGLTALGDLVRPAAEPLPAASAPAALAVFVVFVLARPAVALLVLAVAVDVGVGIGVGVAAAAALASLAAQRPLSGKRSTWESLAVRAVAAVATVGAVDLVVDGVFAI